MLSTLVERCLPFAISASARKRHLLLAQVLMATIVYPDDAQLYRFKCEIDDSEEVICAIKKLVGKNASATNISWLYAFARLTDDTQEKLEGIVTGNRNSELTLTAEEFILFVRASLGKLTVKRNSDGVTERERGAALMEDAVKRGLYTAFAAAKLWLEADAWLEEQMERVEESMDAARERCTERGDERADKLEEIKEEMDAMHDNLQNYMHDYASSQDMYEAIYDGDPHTVIAALQDGTFQLDIGEDPNAPPPAEGSSSIG